MVKIYALFEFIGLIATLALIFFVISAIIIFFVEWKKFCEKTEGHLYDIKIIAKNIEDSLYEQEDEEND